LRRKDRFAMRKRARLPESAVLAAVAGVLVLALASPGHAAFPGKNGRIAFTVEPRERGEAISSTIETVLPSGRGRRPLGTCPSRDCAHFFPSWSPSGRRLAFGVRRTGPVDRFAIVRANGTGFREVPQLVGRYPSPAWAPSGRRLLFPGEDGLFTARTDGTRVRRVTSKRADFDSAWSETGIIAFANDDDVFNAPFVDDGLYTVAPDGTRLRRLVRDRFNASSPATPDWSPHGSKIAFGYVERDEYQVHVADAATGAHRALTTNGGGEPAWSPDGRFLAFIRDGDLYVMRSNGRGKRRILDGGQTESGQEIHLGSPSWQPLPR
jgi:Tol biopolymer transport system component